MARRKLHLHGSLKALAPNGLELEADTVMEAVNGMCRLLRIKPNAITGRLSVKVLGFETLELLHAFSDTQDLHIIPAFSGRGLLGDVIKIVVGTVLIVAGVFLAATGNPILGSFFINAGAALLLGGLMNILFPIKTAQTGGYLGPPGNTTAIGTPIGLVFGQVLSYNVDAVQVSG